MDLFTASMVIFDFDGVIVDTEPLHYRSFQVLLEPLGLGFSWEDYVKVYMGFDDRDAFQEAFRRGGRDLSGDLLQEMVSRKAEVFQQVIRDGVTAYPGVVELIRGLHAAGIPLAISSGALKSDIDPILALLGIAGCFQVIVTADDVVRSKPDPASYQLAYQRLAATCPGRGPEPASTIAIEDTPAGIAAAKGAGLKVMAVGNSYPPNLLHGADLVVTTLEGAGSGGRTETA